MPIFGVVGFAFTWNVVDWAQPSEFLVYVRLVVPAAIACTKPELDTVATDVLLLDQLPPVLGLSWVEVDWHDTVPPEMTGVFGTVFTTTLDRVGLLQLFRSVNVNEYVWPGVKFEIAYWLPEPG